MSLNLRKKSHINEIKRIHLSQLCKAIKPKLSDKNPFDENYFENKLENFKCK